MRTALVIADLEGVAGVDTLDALVGGTEAHAQACRWLTEELAATVRGLVRGGFEHIRISDSHRSGIDAPNVIASELPPEASLERLDDAYDDSLFEGVHAVACVGMHAAAGTRGFAAHTVDTASAWRIGARSLSETELVFGLAAERGIPALFVSGDDVLGRALRRTGVTYVQTKRALSIERSRSRRRSSVLADLAAAARSAPKALRPLPAQPLRVRFKSAWQLARASATSSEPREPAEQRARAATASWRNRSEEPPPRTDALAQEFVIPGPTLRDRYVEALRACVQATAPLALAVRERPGAPGFVEDANALLLRKFPAKPPSPQSRRAAAALGSFLKQTDGSASWQRADRALTLHMLRHLAPDFFRKHPLQRTFEQALAALAQIPRTFESGLHAAESMARIDAAYLERLHLGKASAPLELEQLRVHLLVVGFTQGATWAWLLGELATRAGFELHVADRPQPVGAQDRADELYALTHVFMLETDYFARPLRAGALASETERLLLATPWVVRHRSVDLAAELAICLRAAGEHRSREHAGLIQLVARHQKPDGRVDDPAIARRDPDGPRLRAHATAAGLLAFASTTE